METLDYGEYKLPSDCVVKRNNDIVVIRKSKCNRVTGFRCRDCVYFVDGVASKVTPWITKVCLQKPKCVLNGKQLYFTVRPYHGICEKFEQNK